MVKLILFVHKEAGDTGSVFLHKVKQQFQGIKIQTCREVTQLKHAFEINRYNGLEKRIVVFFLDDEKRLEQLSHHAALFESEQVVALLPQRTKKILNRVNRFYPRYLGEIDGAYTDVCAVLKKMIEK